MSNLKNKQLEPLTQRQINDIEYYYKRLWFDRGTIGNAMLWHDVIVEFLLREGYEITKKGPKEVKGDNNQGAK